MRLRLHLVKEICLLVDTKESRVPFNLLSLWKIPLWPPERKIPFCIIRNLYYLSFPALLDSCIYRTSVIKTRAPLLRYLVPRTLTKPAVTPRTIASLSRNLTLPRSINLIFYAFNH
ncbi:hypothetical protein A0H81_03043 [Grifola frondosa]|uniref:Uncharacterized protein n=1 Tax=Grifola frondosa TaxID=5627 RepID=A0A1C7MIR4_GRIFR|nr:hypothetical protein A0H81_03043 [Grifola frondosa]